MLLAKLEVNGNDYEIEGILFDKDGTLIELHTLWSTWFEHVWKEVKRKQPEVTCTKEKVSESIGLDMKNRIISAKGPLAIGTMEDIAIIISHHLYLSQLPWNEAVQTVRNSMKYVHNTIDWNQLLKLVRGLEGFLEKARKSGIKMGVVTSDDTDIARTHLRLLNIDHFFHAVIGSDQIGLPKPYPDIGYQACKEMQIDPHHVVVIGDTNSDMNLGQHLKAKGSIGMLTDESTDEGHLKDADHVIRHYNQLSIM